ncbi:MAG: tetratricopeptide repeat protein, partial [Bacteroidales bacterium]|nr:tetratricopeptide repeat protein [Bacteroidales bacterium]
MKTFCKNILTLTLLLVAFSASAQTDEKLIRKGNRDYHRGDYTEAEVKYRKALETRANNAKAQFNLGDALYMQENYDGAFAAFQQVLEMTPDIKLKSNAVFNMGNCLLAQGKYYDAFNVYKTALKLNPDNEDALYNLEFCRAHLVKSHIYIYKGVEHGTVEASEEMAFNGQKISLSAKADEGYALKQYAVVRADNTEVTVDVSGSSFVMPTFDVVVAAEFKPLRKIDVEKNIPHGTVMADKTQAVEGQQVKLSANPEPNYLVDRYVVYKTGSRNDTVAVNDTVFSMPDFDVTVSAVFRTAYRVSVDSTEHGYVG